MTHPFRNVRWASKAAKIRAAAGFALILLSPRLMIHAVPCAAGAASGVQKDESAPGPTPTAPSPHSTSAHRALGQTFPVEGTLPPQTVKSKIALVEDANTSEELLVKDAERVVPIASIT